MIFVMNEYRKHPTNNIKKANIIHAEKRIETYKPYRIISTTNPNISPLHTLLANFDPKKIILMEQLA